MGVMAPTRHAVPPPGRHLVRGFRAATVELWMQVIAIHTLSTDIESHCCAVTDWMVGQMPHPGGVLNSVPIYGMGQMFMGPDNYLPRPWPGGYRGKSDYTLEMTAGPFRRLPARAAPTVPARAAPTAFAGTAGAVRVIRPGRAGRRG